MRKITALILAVLMLLTACAFAEEAALVDLDLGDFTLAVPADMSLQMAEEIVSNEAFIMLYENYDENAIVNSNMSILWTDEIIDLSDPEAFGQQLLDQCVMGYELSGISTANPAVLSSSIQKLDGRSALRCILSIDTDYSALELELQTTLYTIQVYVADAAFGGSYIFTITTDKLDGVPRLAALIDSISWNV